MKFLILFLLLIFITFQTPTCKAKTNKNNVIENVVDIKEFKKLIRTKTNVLVCFYNSYKQSQNVIKVFKEVAGNIKGIGTMVLIDCSGDAKKTCKKLKIPNEPFTLKHYKDGEFNKDYDRKYTSSSMTNFMRDPTGDLPWEEYISANNVLHIADATNLSKLIRKESRPLMIMFYAPWCGYCKTLKPEYSQAADDLKDSAVLAAIDVNRPENSAVRIQYNITGFPTILYYENGAQKFVYEGENKRTALVDFMRDPRPATPKPKEPEWSETESEVLHLDSTSFDRVIAEHKSVMVMFYAPWCGHCKRMKPEYEEAAARLKKEKITGALAALDATKEPSVAGRFSVRGYPTIYYFADGEKKYDLNVRDADKIVDFMRDPKEPPPPPPPEKPWSDEASDVVHLKEDTYKPFLKKKKHVLVIFYAPWCGHCKKAKPEFNMAAAVFKDDHKVAFAAVDCTTEQAICSANDVKGYPTFKYFNYYKDSRLYTGGRTEPDFISFMHDPEKVTAPTPTGGGGDWHMGSSILHLNDKNFKAELAKNKIVLVMFYAPWCGHCKRLKPDYTSAAKDLENEGFSQCMAAIDCTANPEVAEQYRIDGFPTIKLFKNGRFVKDYNGKRTLADLKAFVKAHAQKDEL
ncbi:unnamed protein product [Brassicogethes aeneus]|uniref:Thioredoxin domain-containing protein n=1 Tax=Brassicogethes aeneus TaxID=1431903 RepID=A0A9P0FM71_BRAAE|nr:unnamed protein product [Brassicogethes aeneus]